VFSSVPEDLDTTYAIDAPVATYSARFDLCRGLYSPCSVASPISLQIKHPRDEENYHSQEDCKQVTVSSEKPCLDELSLDQLVTKERTAQTFPLSNILAPPLTELCHPQVDVMRSVCEKVSTIITFPCSA